MDFLPLCDVGVVLSNALQSQFLHQVYLVGFLKVLGLQRGRRTNSLEVILKIQTRLQQKLVGRRFTAGV